jgi:hypothetical protein
LGLALDERGINHLARRSFPTSAYIKYVLNHGKEIADPDGTSEENIGLACVSVDVLWSFKLRVRLLA